MHKEYIQELLDNNREWVAEQLKLDPTFFQRAAEGQAPQILWLGCSDSRVPPNEITKTTKGEMFVHRNIANIVSYTDLNFLSVLKYAVEVLKVDHVIVCGHYGCGGVKAAMSEKDHGLLDYWLSPDQDIMDFYWEDLKGLSEHDRFDRLVELHAVEQIHHLGNINIIRNQWKQGQKPYLHAWVYDIGSGLIKPQVSMVNSEAMVKEVCKFERMNNPTKQ